MKFEKKQIVCSAAPSPAGPYSQAITAGPFVFVAGQVPMNVATGKKEGSIADQTRTCIGNIKAILEQAGSSLGSIVKSNVYLSDIGDFGAMNEVYKEMIPSPCPARTTVATMLRGILVEIEVIALLENYE